MNTIKTKLDQFLQTTHPLNQEITFVPETKHPTWDDSTFVIELAEKQILEPIGKLPNEQILSYIGLHAKSRFSNKRDTLGFVITNFRMVIETDVAALFEKEPATIILFSMNNNPKKIAEEASTIFKRKNRLNIDKEYLIGFKNALNEVLEIILSELQKANALPSEIKKATKIDERIKELSIQKDLKSFEEDKKVITKFAEKFNVSDILYAMIDKPFFGSPYGVVITKNGITSRDVMEDPISCTWQEIKNGPAVLGEKKDEFYAASKKHVIPSFNSDSLPNMMILLNELASGEVTI